MKNSTRIKYHLAGYKQAAPSREVAEEDGKIVEENSCPTCGGKMRYEPWVKRGSYIALAVCEKCGEVFEF